MKSGTHSSRRKLKSGIRMLVGIGLIGFGKWAALGQSEPPTVPSPIRMQGSPLQLVLTKTQESPRPLFRAELCNVGKRPLVLNLGFMFPNGKQYPEAIHLILTNANGKTLLLSTMLGVIGGLAETFVVPLPAGATFALPIDLDDYSAPDASKADLPPGSYTLQVHYATPDLPQRSKPSFFWVGTADSNVVQFVVKAQ